MKARARRRVWSNPCKGLPKRDNTAIACMQQHPMDSVISALLIAKIPAA